MKNIKKTPKNKNGTRMKTIVRKHIGKILKHMVVQQLAWRRGNVFFLLYVLIFNTTYVIIAALKKLFT